MCFLFMGVLSSCSFLSLQSPAGSYTCLWSDSKKQILSVKMNNTAVLDTYVGNSISDEIIMKWEHKESTPISSSDYDNFGNCHSLIFKWNNGDSTRVFRIIGIGDTLKETVYNSNYKGYRVFKK